MKLRDVTIFSGQTFQVPERIQRIDQEGTHGWQLRYGKIPTQFFSDHTPDGSGAPESLQAAIGELQKRVRKLPAPNGLRTEVAQWKKSGLPVGISGPYETKPGKKGRTPFFAFQVSVPLPNGGSTTRRTYIGTKNTVNDQRFDQALAKAILIRDEAVRKVEEARTREKRAAALRLETKP